LRDFGLKARTAEILTVLVECEACARCKGACKKSPSKRDSELDPEQFSPRFNQRVSVDLLFIRKRPFFVAECEATRFIVLKILRSKDSELVLAIFVCSVV